MFAQELSVECSLYGEDCSRSWGDSHEENKQGFVNLTLKKSNSGKRDTTAVLQLCHRRHHQGDI